MCKVSAQAVANTFLMKAFQTKDDSLPPITPLKLQKLLYFCYKKYYEDTDEALFSERFEAWPYGPVLRSIYDEFHAFHSDPITKFARNADSSVTLVDNTPAAEQVNIAIGFVWEKYKGYTGIELSNLTHREGTAWYKAKQENEMFLDDGDIREDTNWPERS